MRATFQWGFTLLAERMDRQIKLVSHVASQLDEIHKTLKSPLMTQARELFQLGQERLSKGLLDKALEVFLQSEQKNEVHFLLQLQIGKLLLYGKDRDSDVIDIPGAERHLLLAARFANAAKGSIPKWNEYCAQAYFNSGVAAYLLGEQEYLAGRNDAMRACLERASGFLETQPTCGQNSSKVLTLWRSVTLYWGSWTKGGKSSSIFRILTVGISPRQVRIRTSARCGPILRASSDGPRSLPVLVRRPHWLRSQELLRRLAGLDEPT